MVRACWTLVNMLFIWRTKNNTKIEGHSQPLSCTPQKGYPYFTPYSKACQILEAVFENLFLYGKRQQFFCRSALTRLTHKPRISASRDKTVIRVKHAHTVLSLFFCTVLFGNSTRAESPHRTPLLLWFFCTCILLHISTFLYVWHPIELQQKLYSMRF